MLPSGGRKAHSGPLPEPSGVACELAALISSDTTLFPQPSCERDSGTLYLYGIAEDQAGYFTAPQAHQAQAVSSERARHPGEARAAVYDPPHLLLLAGTRMGPSEVLAPLGAGGMGVYRAKDTKLGREVALEILPEAFASDPDRLMRFEREARTLASLNHPHIAQVYGIEDSGTTRALVMKLVVGEDLSARIARGPIPLDEALPIARQIAEALDVAPDALGASSSGSIAQGARRPLAHRSGPTMSPGFRPAETARCSRSPTRNGTSGCGSSIAAP